MLSRSLSCGRPEASSREEVVTASKVGAVLDLPVCAIGRGVTSRGREPGGGLWAF